MQILSAFSVLLMMSGAMYLFFSYTINRPITDFSRKMGEVEKGNFEVQVPVTTRDELGQLASIFNFMVQSLNELRREEKGQRVLLENRNEELHRKVEESTILHESSKTISRSLQIEEILRMVIENVTKSLEFDRVVLATFDERMESLVGKWSIGIDEDIVQRVSIPREEIKGVLYETLRKREPIVVKDTSCYPIIERRGARKCWEVLNCENDTCPIYGSNELRCWMVKRTQCDLEMEEDTFEEKMRTCGRCAYLKEIVKRSDIINLLMFGSHSFVSAPLLAKEQILGVLLTDRLHSQREITEGDVKLLMRFLSHVSIAMEKAVLYQRLERKIALSQNQLEGTNEQLNQKIEELNEIRRFNESILQNLHGGIVSYNKEGIITFMNRSGAQLLGWEEKEILGRSIDEVFHSDRKEVSLFRKSMEGNGGLSGEMELLRKGSGKIPVEVFLSYLRDKEGRVAGVTGIFRDVTEKREIEARMRRMDKLASLGQLASGIAHEIKNPLAGIGSAIQVLFSSIQVDPRRKEMVKEILNQIHQLDETLKTLLSFARPGEPKLGLNDLNEIIEAVIFLVAQRTKSQNVQIQLNIQKDLRRIMIDPQQIQQALLNVVLNALEAMPSGGILAISVNEKRGVDSARKEKGYLSLVISDTGIGIPEEVMAQIFNPFYTTKPSGTGLGLSITQRIIEQHNGKIDVKSQAEKGTSFTIDLPV